jgi:hypothetical protein
VFCCRSDRDLTCPRVSSENRRDGRRTGFERADDQARAVRAAMIPAGQFTNNPDESAFTLPLQKFRVYRFVQGLQLEWRCRPQRNAGSGVSAAWPLGILYLPATQWPAWHHRLHFQYEHFSNCPPRSGQCAFIVTGGGQVGHSVRYCVSENHITRFVPQTRRRPARLRRALPLPDNTSSRLSTP